MNREAEKNARTETGAGPVVVDMRGRVPLLDDKALATLHANAVRLKDSTNTRQRASVAELLPVIEAELKSRQDLKRATAAAKAPRATKKKVKAAATAGD
jgi:hypothetical protein